MMTNDPQSYDKWPEMMTRDPEYYDKWSENYKTDGFLENG